MNEVLQYQNGERLFIKVEQYDDPIRVEIINEANGFIEYVHIRNRWRTEVRVVHSQCKSNFLLQELDAIDIRRKMKQQRIERVKNFLLKGKIKGIMYLVRHFI